MVCFTHLGQSSRAIFELTGKTFLDQESHLATLKQLAGGSSFYCRDSLGNRAG